MIELPEFLNLLSPVNNVKLVLHENKEVGPEKHQPSIELDDSIVPTASAKI